MSFLGLFYLFYFLKYLSLKLGPLTKHHPLSVNQEPPTFPSNNKTTKTLLHLLFWPRPFTFEHGSRLLQQIFLHVQSAPLVRELGAPLPPQVREAQAPHQIEAAEDEEHGRVPRGVRATRRPDGEPQQSGNDQGAGVEAQPGKVHGQLDAKVAADVVQGLPAHKREHPVFAQGLQVLGIMDWQGLLEDFVSEAPVKELAPVLYGLLVYHELFCVCVACYLVQELAYD